MPTTDRHLRPRAARRLALVVLLVMCGSARLWAQEPVSGSLDEYRRAAANAGTSSSASSSSRSGFNPNGNSNFGDDSDTSATKGLEFHTDIPDSILRQRVFMFRYRPSLHKIYRVWNPTLDPTGIQMHDALDGLNGNYYLSKGTLGQPHIELYPTFASGIRYRLQPDINLGYAKHTDNIYLYQTMMPFTVLSYQSSLNKDYQVRASHTQNIIPGWNVAFDYRLICPDGLYSNSGTKNHYFDASTNYFSADSRLQARAGFIWHDYTIGENGGLTDDSYFFEQKQTNLAGVPVNIYDKASLYTGVEAFAGASYNLVRQYDGYRYRDSLSVRTLDDSTTVLDTIEVVDTLRTRAPRMFNAGVFGFDYGYRREKRVFTDSTVYRQHDFTLYWTNDAYMDHRWNNPLKVTLGIQPRIIEADITPDTMQSWSWLNPFARAVVAVGRGSLATEAMFSGAFGTDIDYRLAALFEMPFDSARRTILTLEAVAERTCPDILMLHDASVYQGVDIRSPSTQRYEAAFCHADWVDLDLRATHMNHNLWYDSLLTVQQGTGSLWLFQASATLRMHLGWMHLDMQQQLQHTTDSLQLPLPRWTSKNSLYADLHLFNRALRLQVGIDLRYHTAFYAPAYDPYKGIFYHQDQMRIGNYIWADAFVNAQIRHASIYLKGGHINAIWETSPTYMLLPHYPGNDYGLFWGVTWKFFD